MVLGTYEAVEIAADAVARMNASRAVVEKLLAASATPLTESTRDSASWPACEFPPSKCAQLQVNLVRSHSCGVGAPLSEAETRAMMLLRANALAKGLSGVRPVMVETLCEMLNHRVHPVIPSQGSVGASGDLAPLAHLAQVVIGEGEAIYQGRKLGGGEAMKRAGIAPVALEAKEGLSLLNGTQGMLALLSLALARGAKFWRTRRMLPRRFRWTRCAAVPAAFDARIMHARAYPGAATTARNLAQLNEGSEIRESHRSAEKDPRVQDAYSLRCTPQVHGAVRDSLSQGAAR